MTKLTFVLLTILVVLLPACSANEQDPQTGAGWQSLYPPTAELQHYVGHASYTYHNAEVNDVALWYASALDDSEVVLSVECRSVEDQVDQVVCCDHFLIEGVINDYHGRPLQVTITGRFWSLISHVVVLVDVQPLEDASNS